MFNEWSYDETATYFYYDPIIKEWSMIDELNSKSSGMDAGIDLDVQNNPHIAWRQKRYLSGSNNDSTMYRYFDGYNWSEPELIVEDPSEQIMIVDENNRSNIFDTEKTEDGIMLIHYYKINNAWQGYIVAESGYSKMHPLTNNTSRKLYVTFVKPIDQDINGEIFFIKTDIISNVYESVLTEKKPSVKIFPNPSFQPITIHFSIASPGMTTLKIYNLKGELLKVLLEKNLLAGSYEVQWDATTKKNVNVKSGLYLVRLQSGKYVVTRSLGYIK
jgi:hypothetical protein